MTSSATSILISGALVGT